MNDSTALACKYMYFFFQLNTELVFGVIVSLPVNIRTFIEDSLNVLGNREAERAYIIMFDYLILKSVVMIV